MLNNSEFTALLGQHESERELLGEVLGISDTLLGAVQNAFPGCGLLKFGNKYIAMDARMPKDSLMYQLFSTNFHEKVRQGKLKRTVRKQLEELPGQVREEILKAPTDREALFPYQDVQA